MSSDLFDCEDSNGTQLGIEMNVHGTLFLSVLTAKGDGGIIYFQSDIKGREQVKNLRDALEVWIDHTK